MTKTIHFYAGVGCDVRLLDPLLAHYHGLGIRSLLVAVQARSPDETVLIDTALAAIRKHDATLVNTTIRLLYSSPHDRVIRDECLKAHCSPGDWIVQADCDEFQVWPRPIREVVEDADSRGFVHVEGIYFDRVAADGGFPELTGEPLWKQFSRTCRLTGFIGSAPGKAVAYKFGTNVGPGQHRIDGDPHPYPDLRVEIHHFKWDASVIRRMEMRRDMERQQGYPWWEPWDRFLQYVARHKGKLDLEDPYLEMTEPHTPYDEAVRPRTPEVATPGRS
jgi:hypothetical protein